MVGTWLWGPRVQEAAFASWSWLQQVVCTLRVVSALCAVCKAVCVRCALWCYSLRGCVCLMGCTYSRGRASDCVCVCVRTHIRQCVWGVVCTAGGVHLMTCVCGGGRGVQQADWAECVRSVWCCGRPEMLCLGSLSPGPHRIPARSCRSARTAGQRRTWGRVVRLSCSQCL